MEKLFLLMPDLTGTRIDLDSQSNKKLTNAEIVAPTGIEKVDLPGLVEDLAALAKADQDEIANREKDVKALNERVDLVISNLDTDALDSLVEIVSAFQSADSDLNETMLELVKTVRGEFAAADDAIKTAVGYENRGPASNADYVAYETAIAEGDAIQELIAKINGEIAEKEALIDKLKADGAPAEDIEAAQKDLDATYAQRDEEGAKLKDLGVEEFSPKNEANFIAWKNAQDATENREERAGLDSKITDLDGKTSEADAGIIAAVGYADRGQASGDKYVAYEAAAAEAESIDAIIAQLDDEIAKREAMVDKMTDDGAPAEYIEAAQKELDATYAQRDEEVNRKNELGIEEFLPKNEVNFIAWADAQTSEEVKNSLGELGKDIFATQEASDKADAEIIAAVGYQDRGEFSEAEYEEYSAMIDDAAAILEVIIELEAQKKEGEAMVAKLTADGAPAEDIEAAQKDLAATQQQLDEEIERYQASGVELFSPKNEVNFIAWLEDKSRKSVDTLKSDINSRIDDEKAASDKADAEIIAVVGYQARGEVSAVKYKEYESAIAAYDPQDLEDAEEEVDYAQAELDKAVKSGADQALIDKLQADLDAAQAEFDRVSAAALAIVPFMPANEVNFIAWVDAQDMASVESLVEKTDTKLSNRIDFIVDNSDPAALDSLTEIVAAFQSSDSDLSDAFNEIAKNIRSEFAAEDQNVRDEFATADTALSSSFATDLSAEIARAEGEETKIRKEFADADTALSSSFATDLSAEIARAEGEEGKIRDEFAEADTALSSSFAADLSTEIQARIDGDNALDGKIAEIISNTDFQSLDSFSEVEKGVNDGFVALKDMIMSVAAGSVEKVLVSPISDGVEVNYTVSTEKPKVFVNGMLQVEDVDYTVAAGSPDEDGHATMVVTFSTVPVSGAQLVIAGVESKHTSGYVAPVIFTPEEENPS